MLPKLKIFFVTLFQSVTHILFEWPYTTQLNINIKIVHIWRRGSRGWVTMQSVKMARGSKIVQNFVHSWTTHFSSTIITLSSMIWNISTMIFSPVCLLLNPCCEWKPDIFSISAESNFLFRLKHMEDVILFYSPFLVHREWVGEAAIMSKYF